MLLDRGGPVNIGMKQPLQTPPVATLNRIEHIAYRWDLLRHPQNIKGCSQLAFSIASPATSGLKELLDVAGEGYRRHDQLVEEQVCDEADHALPYT
jgi:hypothetical protein